MEKIVFLQKEELKKINGGDEATEGLLWSIGYWFKKMAKYAPSTSTLVNCSAT